MENEKRVLDIINEALRDHGKLPINKLNRNESLRDDLGIDSLTMVDIVISFEEEFGIDLFEGGMIQKVDDLLNLLI